MADFTITIEIPNDKVQELLDAYNWLAGGSDGSDPATPVTVGDVRNQEKERIINRMKHVHRMHKVWLRKQNAQADDLGAS